MLLATLLYKMPAGPGLPQKSKHVLAGQKGRHMHVHKLGVRFTWHQTEHPLLGSMLLPPLLSTEVTPPADSQSHLHTINNAKNNLFKNEPTAIDISISIFTVLNLT